MSYLLDTNAVSHAIRGQGRVGERLSRSVPSEIAVSSISVAELAFGVEKRRSKRLEDLVREFLRRVEILKFDEAAAWTYGKIFAQLRSRGEPIGVLDLMIAAHAMSAERVLVTNNTSHFARVAGVSLEDWF